MRIKPPVKGVPRNAYSLNQQTTTTTTITTSLFRAYTYREERINVIMSKGKLEYPASKDFARKNFKGEHCHVPVEVCANVSNNTKAR
mmetsp:Transcript_38293/g.151481  ORF Transcript_38293/g.151481 Transcript_38293/m.151481 type:complete len:87 (+) Transcript_38293:831-1091(+)